MDILAHVSDEILKSIEIMCEKYLHTKAHFDQTYTGIISKIDTEKGTCMVKYAGRDVTIKTNILSVLKIGDMVKVCIPLGNTRKAYLVADMDLLYRVVNENKQ